MPGEVMTRSSPAMHMEGMGRPPAVESTRRGAGVGAGLICMSAVSAAMSRWTASQCRAARSWSSLSAGFPIPTGPIHSAASRCGAGTSILYWVTLLAPLSSVYRHCASAWPARRSKPTPSPTATANRVMDLSCRVVWTTRATDNARAKPPRQRRRIAALGRGPQGLRLDRFPQGRKRISQVGPATGPAGRSADQGPQALERVGPLELQRAQPDPGGALHVVRAVVDEEGAGRGQGEPLQAELVDARIRL